MSEPTLDLTEAIEQAAEAIFEDVHLWPQFTERHKNLGGPHDARHLTARVAIEAAAPVIERAVREQVAREIEWSAYGRPLGLGTVQMLIDNVRAWAAAIARDGKATTEEADR